MFKGNLFNLHGVLITEKKLSDGEFFEQLIKIFEENGMSYAGTYYQLDENGKYVSDLTFLDLYSYIQTAERDAVGMHHIEGMYPFALHIYSSKLQVNLHKGGNPIANFVFSSKPEEVLRVKLVRVNENLVADYDNPVEIDAIECIDQEETWYIEKFGPNGTAIRDALMGILNPSKAKQIDRTQKNIDRANEILAGN